MVFYPLSMLATEVAMRRIDGRLEEAALMVAPPSRVAWRMAERKSPPPGGGEGGLGLATGGVVVSPADLANRSATTISSVCAFCV